MELDIAVVILTYNEELHIKRCIDNVLSISNEIFIVDSFSTDNTLNLARNYSSVSIYQNKWENNHAKQFNWALENLPITKKWVLRIDADEYLTDELLTEIQLRLPHLDEKYAGIIFKRRHIFLGKWIKNGVYPVKLLRMFRYKKAYCENRLMDEHIIVREGDVCEFDSDFVDENLNDFTWWIAKHNNYATREAAELLDKMYNISGRHDVKSNGLKDTYLRFPLFVRAVLYFLIRYIFKFGFLEGNQGFLWHFFQGLWYRLLVDAKIFEIQKKCAFDKIKIKFYLSDNCGIHLD